MYIKQEWVENGLTSTLDLKKIVLAHKNMKDRCYNKNHSSYKHYGERGISVCDEWLNNRDAFIAWSLANGFSSKNTIDRINNDFGYAPDNCRWVSMSIQQSNKRCYGKIVLDGEEMTIYDAIIKSGAKTKSEVSRARKRISNYGVTSIKELSCLHLRSLRVGDRENKCLVCGRIESCKWRDDGALCNTCYCRKLRRSKAIQILYQAG